MADNHSNPTPPPPPPPLPDSSTVPAESEPVVAELKDELPHPPPLPADDSLVLERGDEEDHQLKIPQNLGSFKQESNLPCDLSDSETKAVQDLKQLLTVTDEPSIWGVPLLKDDRTDVILLKFLRAREFKVKDALLMINNTLRWRKDFNIDALLEDQDDDHHLDKVVFMHGHDREGHPVCYNVYGEFQNKELYNKTFSDEQKRTSFLRWRVQFLERSIRKLDFTPGGVNTIVQVNDLKNSPGPAKRELRLATKQALQLLQDNYPEFVAKQVQFIDSLSQFHSIAIYSHRYGYPNISKI